MVYGAGGVGGVIGAELHKAGFPVALIARGEHLLALRGDGMLYQTPLGSERLRVPAVGHPSDLDDRPDDVFLMTMKSQHSMAALETLRAVRGEETPVVCCQNGVANERMALRRFRAVYAMLVYLPAQLIEPGVVQCHSKLKAGVLDLCRFPEQVDALSISLAERLNAANFSVRPDARVMRLKYAKLITNLNNALEAVATPEEDVDDIRKQMRAEARACFSAAGIDFAKAEEVRERRTGIVEGGGIPGVERVGGSSRQSLLRGTGDIEADYLNGEVVQLGRVHGIPTPANAVLQRLAVDAAANRRPPGQASAASIRAAIEREATLA
ncbi:MAG: 2-dehydropantoate 2-reductase N-terminal domain-containing protein [Pseudomonadota bacterium]